MAEEYSREVLRRSVAAICRSIGWHGVCATPLEVLVHVLEKYTLTLARSANRRAEHGGRLEPSLADLRRAFDDNGVRLRELAEYCRCVPPQGCPVRAMPARYPLPKEDKFLPLDGEDPEVGDPRLGVGGESATTIDVRTERAPAAPDSEAAVVGAPVVGGAGGVPSRELSSVAMTESGALAQAREGRLPEARGPDKPPKPDRPDKSQSKRKPEKGKDKKAKEKKAVPPAPLPPPPPPPPPVRIPMPVDPAKVKKEKDVDAPPPPPQRVPISPPVIVDSPPPLRLPPTDPEKLASQPPDRSKLNIFKKISKPKEQRDSTPEKPPPAKRPPKPQPQPAPPPPPPAPMAPVAEKFNFADVKIKEEPVDDYPDEMPPESPVPPPLPPPAPPRPRPVPVLVPIREKKRDKKKKDANVAAEKAERRMEKSEKKRRKMQHVQRAEPPRPPLEGPSFPFFRGVTSAPLVAPPVRDALAGLYANPAIRGLLPPETTLLPNTFSGESYVDALGFTRPPRMPRPPDIPAGLRRPSLEVIPIESDEAVPRFPPSLTVEERPSPEDFFPLDIPATISRRNASPKRTVAMAQIRPDVTIRLNSPPPRATIEDGPEEEPPFAERPPTPTSFVKEKDRSEKKKDKKDKKDKEQRAKKKKEKKEKIKLKLERKREKEEKQELKDRQKKEKKEKRREKEKAAAAAEGLIPKLTLKIGSSSPMVPSSPETSKKLNIKPVVKKRSESPPPRSEPKTVPEPNASPELASFSALVTRPPKPKSSSSSSSKHSNKTEPTPEGGPSSGNSPDRTSPVRKNKPSSSQPKYKRIYFKPIPKRNSSDFDDPINDLGAEEPPPPLHKETPGPGTGAGGGPTLPQAPPGAHCYKDPEGNQVWICPACGMPDNGTPMIGCDGCDAWYHWVCVGIHVAPGDSEDWYCTGCIAKKTATMSALGHTTGKKRGRKPKAEKLREMQLLQQQQQQP